MNLTTAFEKFIERTGHSSLPWQTSRDEMLDIFTSGWLAHAESLKHADDLFPGTLSSEQAPYHASCPVKLTGQNCLPCSEDNAVRAGDRAPITAEDIYKTFPRKVGKKAAMKAITRAAKEVHLASDMRDEDPLWNCAFGTLMERTQLYASHVATWPAADKQFIPHPATWFNRGSYDDDPKEWVRGAAATPSQFRETK